MIVDLTDRDALRTFLLGDPALHLYELGDLDPAFWPACQWHGWQVDGVLRAVAMVYAASRVPSLLLLERAHVDDAVRLMAALRPRLAPRVHAHLSPQVAAATLRPTDEAHGRYCKLVLPADTGLPPSDAAVTRLGPADADAATALYDEAYPGHWFHPDILATGHYHGLRDAAGRLLGAAGVHVVSVTEGVAALGNIVVRADARGQGLGRRLTAAVATGLRKELPHGAHIGLNVRADNAPALRCYEGLGFRPAAIYDEATLHRPR